LHIFWLLLLSLSSIHNSYIIKQTNTNMSDEEEKEEQQPRPMISTWYRNRDDELTHERNLSLIAEVLVFAKNYHSTGRHQYNKNRLLDRMRTLPCQAIVSSATNDGDLADALTYAASRNHVDVVQTLLDNGITVDIKDHYGRTGLLVACQQEACNESVALLLARGANVNFFDWQLGTPLASACSCGDTSVVTLLLQNGADVNKENHKKLTPLMIACKEGF
jgi:hypothetical protein